MAKRNIMEALNIVPDGSLPKNPFDLSSYEYLHTKMGQFIPVGVRETVPDGTYRMSVDAVTLTLPCNTASFAHMKENYYFLFIPYSQLTNIAYSFFPQRKDNQSALDYGYSQMPWFNLGDVVKYCIQKAVTQGSANNDIHGFNRYAGALRLLDLLGYGSYLDVLYVYKNNDMSLAELTEFCTRLNKYKPNALRIAAYQKAWYCYFRNVQYDTEISPRAFNFDDVTYKSGGSEPSYNIMDHRTLEQFVTECLQLRYVPYKKDIFTGSMPGTQWGAVSSLQMNGSAVLTGSTPYISATEDGEGGSWQTVSRIVEGNGSTDFVDADTQIIMADGDVSNGDAVVYARSYNGDNVQGNKRIQIRTSHLHSLNGTINLSSMKLFDVLQLVEAEAIQKWRQKSMLAGQRAQNQYRAHYGVVPRHMEDHYPDFIGSVDNVIDISQVISQANTATADDESNLGDLAGRGYGSSDRKVFTYHASEHGIIMLCRAVVPENLYSSFGLDRDNELIYYTDFWQPELQNIGLEAVPKELIDTVIDWTADGSHQGDASYGLPSTGRIGGYAPRNYQLKQYHSKVHGMFNPSRMGSLSYIPSVANNLFGFADFQAFVQTRGDLIPNCSYKSREGTIAPWNYIAMNLSKFYVNPSMANATFAVDADSYEDTDQFIHEIRFNCEAIQPLSVLGLPQF